MFGMGQLETILIFIIAGGIYLVPTIIAYRRKHEKATTITLLSILLGWTLIAWGACLVWACSGNRTTVADTTRICPHCNKIIPANAQTCQHCATEGASFIEADAVRPQMYSCVKCGASNRSEYLTCVGCGTPMPT